MATVPWMVLSLVVLVVAALLARQGVPGWAETIFRGIYGLPDFISEVLWLPMQLGSAWAPPLVAIVAWIVWRLWRPAVGALVVGLGAWWLAKGVKGMIGRGRPADELDDIVLRPGAPIEGLGFVSGHTTVAFALASVLAPYLRPWMRVVAYGLAAVVGFARIHVGAHLFLDVVGGAALGCVCGWLWNVVVGVPEVVLQEHGARVVIGRSRRRSQEAVA
jgi:undecaprenyl-diphosphatase